MNNKADERRDTIRKRCNLVIDLAQRYMGIIRDISTNGLYVETINSFELGEPVPLSFPHFTEYPRKFRLYGKVVRITKKGVGIQFTGKLKQSYDTREHIQL